MLAFSKYINFENFNWWWLIVGLIVWLLIFFLTKAYKPKFIILKALLWLLTIFSLTIILNQPKIKTKTKTNKVVLLTTKNAVEKFEETEKKSENTFLLSRLNIDTKLDEVINLDYLLHLKKQIAEIEIIGNGLTVKELENLPNLPIRFNLLDEEKVSGVFEINYPKTVFAGEPFTINLSLANDTTAQFYKVDYDVDTLKIKNSKIELNHQLSTVGKHLIKLNLYSSIKKLIDKITIPIEVVEKKTANVLMLNGYPFFEHLHLKEFIGKQNHQLWVRTATSIGKYRYDYINTEQEKSFSLSTQFLKQIDVLIIDGASLKALSTTEYNAINRQRKNGMGVLLRVDQQYDSALNKWDELKLGIKRTANSNRDFITINKDEKAVEIEIFPFQNSLPSTKLIKGEGAGKVLSTNKNEYKPFCITNIKNSYLFNLRGDSTIYNWLWKNIIDECIPQKYETANVWRLKNDLANVEENYIEMELLTNETEPEAYLKTPSNDWLRLSLQQSYINNELFETTFWPQQSGWYYFKTALDTIPQQIYVSDENENILLRNNFQNRLKDQLIQHHNKSTNALVLKNEMENEKPFPLFWNWLVFIISLSLILIIEKFL